VAGTLNRSALLKTVSERTGMARKEVEQVYEHTMRTIQDAVKAGMARNPFTGEMVKVAARPAQKLPKFLPAKQFKEYVSGTAKLPPIAAAKKAAPKKAAAKKSTAKKKK
jgi:nucleoid DNA-binding protein